MQRWEILDSEQSSTWKHETWGQQQGQDLNFGLSDLKLGVFAVCYTSSSVMTEYLRPKTAEGFLAIRDSPTDYSRNTKWPLPYWLWKCVSVGAFFACGNIFISLTLLEWDDNFWIAPSRSRWRKERESSCLYCWSWRSLPGALEHEVVFINCNKDGEVSVQMLFPEHLSLGIP